MSDLKKCKICGTPFKEIPESTTEGICELCQERIDAISEINNRKSAWVELKAFDYLCDDETAYVEVTEWANCSGVDVEIYEKTPTLCKKFELSYGEMDAIIALVNKVSPNSITFIKTEEGKENDCI